MKIGDSFKVDYQTILLFILIGIILLFAVLQDGVMLRPKVLFGLTENVVETGLMALPMTYIITTGGIDLSVGSTMALAAVVMGAVAENHSIWLAILACLLVGVLCGALNGLIISRTKISPLVTTLATQSLFYGIARIVGGTNIYTNYPEWYMFLERSKFLGIIPYQFLLFIVLFLLFNYIYEKTVVGRYLRGVGYNEAATKYAGIDVKRVNFKIYLVAGITASVSALIYLSRLPAAMPDIGLSLELETITAVVLGGTSIVGGVGSVKGTFLSVLILGVLRKGLQLIGLGGDIYSFILGIVLVVCLVSFSYINRRGKQGSEKKQKTK